MNLNLERFYSKNSVRNIFVRTGNKLSISMINRLASMALLVVMLPTSYVSFVGKENSATFQSSVKLDTVSATPVTFDQSTPVITLGESKINQENRIKAEEAQKAESARLALINRNTVTREYRVYSDPSNFDEIYVKAGNAYGVDPMILKAIHIVETGASGSTSRANPSGATGPMQFLRSTWNRHGVDGNGDGVKDINNVEDAIFSASAYLKACGWPNAQKALWGYNPSTRYYNKVIGIAQSLGYK